MRFNSAGKPEEAGAFANGEKDGEWLWYNDMGKVEYSAKFQAGKMVSQKKK